MSKSVTRKLRNIHPGEVLREEFLIPLGVTQYRLAKEIGVTEARISAICSGKRSITADTALRLAAFFWHFERFLDGLAGGLRYRRSGKGIDRRAGADTSV
jgi:addiction module HigA family antidote